MRPPRFRLRTQLVAVAAVAVLLALALVVLLSPGLHFHDAYFTVGSRR